MRTRRDAISHRYHLGPLRLAGTKRNPKPPRKITERICKHAPYRGAIVPEIYEQLAAQGICWRCRRPISEPGGRIDYSGHDGWPEPVLVIRRAGPQTAVVTDLEGNPYSPEIPIAEARELLQEN